MKEKEIEEMKELRQRGLSYQKISEITGHSKTTIMKYVGDVKVDKSLAIRGGSMIQLSSNPLDALANLDELVKLSTSTGVAVGSSIASLHKGFTDDSLTDADRALSVMKGSAFLGNVAFSAYRTLQELTKQTKEREIKTVPSPSYDELVEKVVKLEKERSQKNRKTNENELNGA